MKSVACPHTDVLQRTHRSAYLRSESLQYSGALRLQGGGRCLSNEAVALDMEVGIFVNGDRGGIGIEMV